MVDFFFFSFRCICEQPGMDSKSLCARTESGEFPDKTTICCIQIDKVFPLLKRCALPTGHCGKPGQRQVGIGPQVPNRNVRPRGVT